MAAEPKKPVPGAQLGEKMRQFQERLAKEPMPDIFNRPELQNRATAALIDCVAAAIAWLFFSIGGRIVLGNTGGEMVTGGAALLCALFLLLKDGVKGQSPGKKLVGLRVVRTNGAAPVDFITSAMRNWPLALLFAGPVIGTLLAIVPGAAYIAMMAMLCAVALVGYEIYRVMTDRQDGLRMGDHMAKTRVVED